MIEKKLEKNDEELEILPGALCENPTCMNCGACDEYERRI